MGTTLSDRAAVSSEDIKADAGAVSGLNIITARLSPGAISESSRTGENPQSGMLGGIVRIGVLTPGDENDPVWKPNISAFTQALADLGWTDGRNVRMDLRWHGDDNNRA